MTEKELPILKLDLIKRNVPQNYTGIIIFQYGTKSWYLNGEMHREDGPACEHNDGSFSWFLYGKKYWSFEEFFEATTDAGREALIWRMDEY